MKSIIKHCLVGIGMVYGMHPLMAQCVQSCSLYNVYSINYSVYPQSGNLIYLGDDDTSALVPIGFNFNFYCQNHSAVKVCSNGFISFAQAPFTPSLTPYAQQLPDPNQPNAVIAFNWNDLDPTAGGLISYTTIGISPNQRFIVTYTNIPLWSYGGSNSGQIVLNEIDNSIEIHVGNVINNGWLTHTEGIENSNGNSGLTVSGRNLTLWNASNSSHKWQKAIVGLPPQAISGNTLLCMGQSTAFSVSPVPGLLNYSWTLPGGGWQGSGTSSILQATAGLSGTISVSANYTCGSSLPATISVSVNPSPLINLLGISPSTVCSGQPLTLSMSGSSNYTVMPGNYSGISPITFTPVSSQVYSIYATSVNGCTTTMPPTANVPLIPTPTLNLSSGTLCLGQSFNLNPQGGINYTLTSPFSIVTPSATGLYSYTLTGSAANNCTANAFSQLTVVPSPQINASATRTLICLKEFTGLFVGGASNYTWSNGYFGNSQSVNPSVTTLYTVSGANAYGCLNTATVIVQVQTCQSISFESLSSEPQILLVHDMQGTQWIKGSQEITNLTYLFSDLNGKTCLMGSLESAQINCNMLYPGVYIVKLFKNLQGVSCQRILLYK